ncbi:universal stress protein [Streptomyces olivaceus]|uniref:universal stress protein n=1 Tax=Streptomyces olivaceus TaxID=47716 RepID=UPI0036805B24
MTENSRFGSAGSHLVHASHDASRVVVGRRVGRTASGMHIGAVSHEVMHHATTPVGVVAHG